MRGGRGEPRQAARHPLHAGEVGADPPAREEGPDADLALRRAVLPARGRAGGGRGVHPPGHPLALPEDEQRGLLADSLALARSAGVPVEAPGGVRVVLPAGAVVRFLLLSEEDGG